MKDVLRSITMGDIIFNNVFLNEDKDIAFRYCSAYPNGYGEYIFKIKEGQIIVKSLDGKIIDTLTRENGFDFKTKKALFDSKNIISKDIMSLSKRLESDMEKIIVFSLNDDKIPYLFTSQTILDNGAYSPKYNSALLYHINKHRGIGGKSIFKDISDMLLSLGKLLKPETSNMKLKTMGKEGSSKYYELDLSYLANL